MAEPALHYETQPKKQIAIHYTPEASNHCPVSNSITLTYNHRGGSRWRSTTRFLYGTFSSLIQCPKGNTSGLNFNIYLYSPEGDKSQDEIDFEFLGKDKTVVQTNYYTKVEFKFNRMVDRWEGGERRVEEGWWTGSYVGCDAPYVCLYKDICVPAGTAVECSSDS
ncbi:hypothetical protein JCGZ_14464 [Jatropha curcas]|uniref:GH16 domain-containing protein n=1 Tax=Jatropha curcas TaxID=180498 RepID=A0A067K0X4_JATCU|nr:hypothetical protein JCGZ_14464 [Jatropha curcas]